MSEPTYAACLTLPGTGAIAVVAVAGPQAISTVEMLFRPSLAGRASDGSPNLSLALRANDQRFFLGRFGDEVADEVVVSVKQASNVEIHSHGGIEVVRLMLDSLQRRGIQIVTWQELESITNSDPLRAAAAIALAEARTVRTAAILLDQYHGAFAWALTEAVAGLEKGDGGRLRELIQQVGLGRHLTEPWRVVVAGAPNVGKSSLVNALAGYQRSVVSAIPGTTRDVVTTEIAVDGWPVKLMDTAGWRETAENLEAQGIKQARAASGTADLCLWVLDASAPPIKPAFPVKNVRLVVNKIDLPAAWDRSQEPESLPVSATTGEGIPELCAALANWLVPEPPPSGAAVPFTAELCARVEEAWRLHASGKDDEARRLLIELQKHSHPLRTGL